MLTLEQLLEQLSPHCQIKVDNEANLSQQLNDINTLNKADGSSLSFLDKKVYLKDLAITKALAVFIHNDLADKVPQDVIALKCDEPYVALAYASKYFSSELVLSTGHEAKVSASSVIQANVTLGKNVIIGERTTIMSGSYIADNVIIGDDVTIYPNVCIYHSCHVGSQVIIHAGTVIGSDGFGFAMSKSGEYVKIYQNGNVVIGNNVEIGANCAIDRAAFSSTIIEDQVRLDNLVHIAHNCVIGKRSILAGQVGLAGTTILGEQVIMGGQAAAAGHLEVAPFTTIAGRGAVTKSLKEGGHYAGFPLMPHRIWLKLQGRIQKLLK